MNTSFFRKNKFYIATALFIAWVASFFFDRGLGVGLGILFALSFITFFILDKFGFKDKKIYLLFIIAMVIHLGLSLFMYYFPYALPYSARIPGKDYMLYQNSALIAYQSFKCGDFSIKDIISKHPDFYVSHCFPVLVGGLYALTMPEMVIGLIVNVWLVILFIIFAYLITMEIGGSETSGFIVGIIMSVYPTLALYGSFLLKDPLEICMAAAVLFFTIKLIKKFNFWQFIILYLLLIPITNLRFYLGYALMLTFTICWFIFCKSVELKKKFFYIIIMILFFGFLPQLVVHPSQGYMGIRTFKDFLNPETITNYRQVLYVNSGQPIPMKTHLISSVDNLKNSFSNNFKNPLLNKAGKYVWLFLINSKDFLESFVFIFLGPFPWQITKLSHAVALFEAIPWYFLLYFVIKGIIKNIKKKNILASPLLVFSLILLIVISIFDGFYGLAMRIRIPAFMCLLCFLPFGINENSIKNIGDYINNKLKIL